MLYLPTSFLDIFIISSMYLVLEYCNKFKNYLAVRILIGTRLVVSCSKVSSS